MSTQQQQQKKPQIVPRAAVSVVVKFIQESEKKYVLVQRGKEPNKGMWSLPGGKIEVGEESISAAKRELWEETGLGIGDHDDEDSIHNHKDFDFLWCEDGPVCLTDSIHKSQNSDNGDDDEEEVLFHYCISQWFVEAKRKNSSVVTEDNIMSSSPPILIPSDDATDARWWNLDQIRSGIQNGEVTSGVEKVIVRSELMYDKGLLH